MGQQARSRGWWVACDVTMAGLRAIHRRGDSEVAARAVVEIAVLVDHAGADAPRDYHGIVKLL